VKLFFSLDLLLDSLKHSVFIYCRGTILDYKVYFSILQEFYAFLRISGFSQGVRDGLFVESFCENSGVDPDGSQKTKQIAHFGRYLYGNYYNGLEITPQTVGNMIYCLHQIL